MENQSTDESVHLAQTLYGVSKPDSESMDLWALWSLLEKMLDNGQYDAQLIERLELYYRIAFLFWLNSDICPAAMKKSEGTTTWTVYPEAVLGAEVGDEQDRYEVAISGEVTFALRKLDQQNQA